MRSWLFVSLLSSAWAISKKPERPKVNTYISKPSLLALSVYILLQIFAIDELSPEEFKEKVFNPANDVVIQVMNPANDHDFKVGPRITVIETRFQCFRYQQSVLSGIGQ